MAYSELNSEILSCKIIFINNYKYDKLNLISCYPRQKIDILSQIHFKIFNFAKCRFFFLCFFPEEIISQLFSHQHPDKSCVCIEFKKQNTHEQFPKILTPVAVAQSREIYIPLDISRYTFSLQDAFNFCREVFFMPSFLLLSPGSCWERLFQVSIYFNKNL